MNVRLQSYGKRELSWEVREIYIKMKEESAAACVAAAAIALTQPAWQVAVKEELSSGRMSGRVLLQLSRGDVAYPVERSIAQALITRQLRSEKEPQRH